MKNVKIIVSTTSPYSFTAVKYGWARSGQRRKLQKLIQRRKYLRRTHEQDQVASLDALEK
eukprot:CAMPEP_0196247228 /NCGR_PEP_ID=MMETSP0913-20130531/37631_1 /TAXON_ID=49265 /ORGANISM="Thalassiosira rotula, Strain GSO102" /LENGTH=59 /DNA_ID=CAMNT_0041532111 /DNA_START=125 /DNA_END=301 /DNA_ORIENTATION=-